MNKTRALLVVALVLEGMFVVLSLAAPLAVTASINGWRQATQVLLTALLVFSGAVAVTLAWRGARLWEVAVCLLLLGPIHLVAGGTQTDLVWLPISLGLGSLLITATLAWRNA